MATGIIEDCAAKKHVGGVSDTDSAIQSIGAAGGGCNLHARPRRPSSQFQGGQKKALTRPILWESQKVPDTAFYPTIRVAAAADYYERLAARFMLSH
jgi:hypothetical protein